MRDKSIKISLLVFLIAICAFLGFWANRPVTKSKSFFAMGTVFEITATGKNIDSAMDAAFSEIQRIENLTGNTGKSDIIRINQNAGIRAVKVSPETLEILKKIQEYYHEIPESFDPTVAPLVELWGFGPKGEPDLPSVQSIKRILPLVNFNLVKIDFKQQTVFLPKSGMKLDLGGIAKGYAIDRVYLILKNRHIDSALINGGSSSIRVIGTKSGTPWILGIGHPRTSGKLLGTLTLPDDRALGTSADTQNYFIKNGIRYSHLIHPQTGMPNREKILVTVTAPTAMIADLLSTAFFILPQSKIKIFLKKHPDIKVLIYDSNQKFFNLGEKTFKSEKQS